MNILKVILVFVFGVVCFVLGSFWNKASLLESNVVELMQPLTLQHSPDNLGILPAGTKMYSYQSGPSTETFVVFVNTQNMSVLKPTNLDHFMTVDPIDGYIE
jgi:hypothetical protein